ncbi:hypothetical protein BH10PSE7_BH10PSE7_05050 [soil metagenome]
MTHEDRATDHFNGAGAEYSPTASELGDLSAFIVDDSGTVISRRAADRQDSNGTYNDPGGPVVRRRERRADKRHQVLKKAVIIFNEKSSTMNCVVSDLSNGGARLIVPFAAELPSIFTLWLVAENVIVEVERVRRAPNDIGVKFIGDLRRHT